MKMIKQAKRVTNKLLKEFDGPQMKGTIKKEGKFYR